MRSQILALAAASLFVGGCVSSPEYCDVGYGHASFPTLGYPFGPETEEGTLDYVGPACRWGSGKASFEGSLNYKIPDSDLYGNDFIFVGRVAYKIWEPRH